jgi:hypothetical protein
VEYVRLVPDSIARPPGRPAGLLASDSGTGPRIEPNHAKALADLFTAAWQHPFQCLSAWALALATCWGIHLWWVSFTRFAAAMISCLLTSSISPSQRRMARCERACEGLGLQFGASIMCCKIFKQSCKVQVQRFYQRDKTKSWSGLKLSCADGDWNVDLEQWLEYDQRYYSEIFKQSCKVQRFLIREIKQRADLAWSWAVQMEIGSWPWAEIGMLQNQMQILLLKLTSNPANFIY